MVTSLSRPSVLRPSSRDRRRATAATAVLSLAVAGFGVTAPAAQAASVTSAAFSGGTGTYTATNAAVYAKQGAALTLTVNTDANTRCVDVIDGNGDTIATKSGSTSNQWVFSGSGYPWLTAASGSGVVTYTTKAWRNVNGQGKCVANQNEAFGVQAASYTLDNTAPTATGALSPVPNGAGWNRGDVTVTWTGNDTAGSGVKTIAPATDSVSTEGTTTRTATITDNVGNVGTGSVTVKLDKTAPTITGSRAPAANTNGWNNSDVTVSFQASDATAGIKSASGPTTVSANGANQSVTGTAVDNADNTTSTTVGGINIDKVAPTLTGAPMTNPNSAGWYRGDVGVAWTATDALSGVTAPANGTIGGEGAGLTVSATVTDRAGNSSGSVQSSPAVKIDRTAPNTTVTAPPAWNKTDVTLTLVPNDALSGVDTTWYRLDGADPVVGTTVPVSGEGDHTLTFWSTDVAGNTEGAHSVSFGIDKTSPTIGHTQWPAANPDGWNKADVTITFTCSDALSGVESCTGARTVTTEGLAQVVTGTVTDKAGNTATDPAQVSIDKTKPVIVVDPMPEPNGHGWFGSPVTATYTASDALSGVKSQDRSHTFGEGAAQTHTASATDAAGNTASVTTPEVNVDTTAPTIVGEVVDTPNGAGWFTDDVTVRWTCSDNLSGVVNCPPDSVVSGEGSALSASASVTDKAGHTSTATVSGIKIDRTVPHTSANGVPTGWARTAVTVALAGTDNLSGVATTYYSVDGAPVAAKGDTVSIGTEGVHTVAYWSVDAAGNSEPAQSFTIRIDLSDPTIQPSQAPVPNSNGWNNSDVSVIFGCSDQTHLSGLATCTEPVAVTTEGEAQPVTGTATDHAGNSTSATATVNIDKTAPTITGAPDREANGAGWYADDVTVAFKASDDLSGIDTVSGPATVGEGRAQEVRGAATDNAGNSAVAVVSGLNVDKTAPMLSAAATSEPNMYDWYNGPVTFTWTADDPLSGLDGPAPGDSVLTSEGEGLTASARVLDLAGNRTDATSPAVRIDRTAPVTDVSAPSGWINESATVTFSAFDALSGVSSTHYVLDDGAEAIGDSVTLLSEGTHTLVYWSGDKAGNVEVKKRITVQIDKTDPTIDHALDPAPNGNGWNRSDVMVIFTCHDQASLSGIASCTGSRAVTDETAGEAVVGTAVDHAGNSATDTATVRLDRTAPTITGSVTPQANDFGWNNTEVTVSFTAADALSGVASVTAPKVLSEGEGQSVEGTAVDAADNEAHVTVDGINVDLTAPALSGEPTSAANANGWYRGDVAITWTSSDELSGIVENPENGVITGEGIGLTTTAVVRDRAGNETNSTSAAVRIDRTAPITTASAPEGWRNQDVLVALEATDGLSGVDKTYYRLNDGDTTAGSSVLVEEEGENTLRFWSVDEASNVEEVRSVTVRVDRTDPTVGYTVTPAPNQAGWNRSPVTVSYDCDDDLSGVASCSPDRNVATDGADQPVPGTAVDRAGNSSTIAAAVSIDTVDPTISGAPDRSPNDNDWYAGDVTVSYTCDDALSGVASCTAPKTLREGAAQSATGTAIDVAGNSADATVTSVNVDKTAPTLTGSAVQQPNDDGWYRSDVSIRWTAEDALSGLDGPPPADSVLTGEGNAVSASTSVQDRAGNQRTASSSPVKIDRTSPTTDVSHISDWSNEAVTVDLTAGDTLSGVRTTRYQLDDAEPQVGNRVVIDTEGVHALKVWSEDRAGNIEAHRNVVVKIDRTAPGINHVQSPAANKRGWNRTDVTVTFTCSDDGSDIESCTGSRTVTTEGGGQQVNGLAVDRAGNSAHDSATVSIDKTRPTVTGGLSAAANGNGWFNADVVATFTCADQDELSGVLSCPSSKTFGEGGGQGATVTATDGADNESRSFEVTGVNVDKTAPSLNGHTTSAPNAAGWYRGDVAVQWDASDDLSGLDGPKPDDSVVTGEGAALAAQVSVTDRAGNETSATVGGIAIDRTAPATIATVPGGWQAGDVTVRFTASDALSTVAVTHFRVDSGSVRSGSEVTVDAEGSHQVTFWSVDKAGNSEASKSVTVLVDKSRPTITGSATTAPNAAGWHNTPVTVAFVCADSVSGLASCSSPTTTSAQGANSVTGFAVDNAGNSASATVSGIKVDTVAPVVTIGGVSNGAQYTLGAVPTPSVAASDATSGLVAPASGTRSGGLANGVGTFTYTATATDRAGNVGTATVTFTVVYGFGTTLFLQPVNDTAHQTGVATSVFNAGQTIPMKFELRNASGQVVQTTTAPRWLTPVKGSSTSAAVNEAAYAVTATAGGTYVLNGTQYQYNWKTDKGAAGSYWRVGVALDDGQTYYVNIALR